MQHLDIQIATLYEGSQGFEVGAEEVRQDGAGVECIHHMDNIGLFSLIWWRLRGEMQKHDIDREDSLRILG